MRYRLLALVAFALPSPRLAALGLLENPQPGAKVSGVSVVSGWNCDATRIDLQFDDGPTIAAGYRTARPDTQSACGRSDTGYSLLFNWNTLGPGTHTVRALADGVEFANATFTVTTLGVEFLTGKNGSVRVNDFPDVGRSVVLEWQQSQQNFAIAQLLSNTRSLSDTWYGSDLETRTNCIRPENNGQHGTFSYYTIRADPQANTISITQSGVTGLSCSYSGTFSQSGTQRQAAGTFSCSDGKQGSWASNDFTVTDNTMLIKYSAQLSGAESCAIAGLFSGARP